MASEKTQPIEQSDSGPPPQELPAEAYPVSDNRGPVPQPPPPPAGGGGMPTVEDPFSFPADEALPAYSAHASDTVAVGPPSTVADGAPPSYHPSGNTHPNVMMSSSSTTTTTFSFSMGGRNKSSHKSKLGHPPKTNLAASTMRPVAIPQVVPSPSSPFVGAYPPCLLARGITETTWRSFLDTVSAFLTATVGDRAISHAGDMARHLTADTTNLGKNLAGRSKQLGKGIARYARRGNIIGVAATLVGGAITLPLAAAFGTVGTVTRLPGAMIGAVVKRPQTPAERVNAYTAVANKEWLNRRGLHAQLVNTVGLAHVLELQPGQLLAVARGGKEGSAEGMLQALDVHIEPLKVEAGATLGLSEKTLWLVLVEIIPAPVAAEQKERPHRGGDTVRESDPMHDSISEEIRQVNDEIDQILKQSRDEFDKKFKQSRDDFDKSVKQSRDAMDQSFKEASDAFDQKFNNSLNHNFDHNFNNSFNHNFDHNFNNNFNHNFSHNFDHKFDHNSNNNFNKVNHGFGGGIGQGGSAQHNDAFSVSSQQSKTSKQRKGFFGLRFNAYSHSSTTATCNTAPSQEFSPGSSKDNEGLGKGNWGAEKGDDGSFKDIYSSEKSHDSSIKDIDDSGKSNDDSGKDNHGPDKDNAGSGKDNDGSGKGKGSC